MADASHDPDNTLMKMGVVAGVIVLGAPLLALACNTSLITTVATFGTTPAHAEQVPTKNNQPFTPVDSSRWWLVDAEVRSGR